MSSDESTRSPRSVTWRYVVAGAVFGLLFPLASVAFLHASGLVAPSPGSAGFLVATHTQYPLLFVIDTAPLFLGLFAGLAGVRQTRLIALNASLEQQVSIKTASLREALQRAEKTNELISYMADHDALTGLLNRRRMHRELVTAVAQGKRYGAPFAIAFVDLNRFKSINDQHGHEGGDRFLIGFASLLEKLARESDLLGRWGGDEFVVLLPQTTRSGAELFAQRLRQQLARQLFDVGGTRIAGAASVGIAVHPTDGDNPEALLAQADQDMYRDKHLPHEHPMVSVPEQGDMRSRTAATP